MRKKLIGTQQMAKCGMIMTLVDYRDNTHVDVRFEDGTLVCDKSFDNFRKGQIGHPTVNLRGGVGRNSKIADFLLDFYAFGSREEGAVYYACHCQHCGFSNILTPQEMLEHQKKEHSGE